MDSWPVREIKIALFDIFFYLFFQVAPKPTCQLGFGAQIRHENYMLNGLCLNKPEDEQAGAEVPDADRGCVQRITEVALYRVGPGNDLVCR